MPSGVSLADLDAGGVRVAGMSEELLVGGRVDPSSVDRVSGRWIILHERLRIADTMIRKDIRRVMIGE